MKSAALAIFILVLAPLQALACSDPNVPSFRENLSRAEHVFVFRLTSLELTDSTRRWPSALKGQIELTHVLKGRIPATSAVALTAGVCCGAKLSVGRYYVAALVGDPEVLELVPGDQSILDVTDDFKSGTPGSTPNLLGLWPIQQHLLGQPLPLGFPSAYQLESTVSCPPLPVDHAGGT